MIIHSSGHIFIGNPRLRVPLDIHYPLSNGTIPSLEISLKMGLPALFVQNLSPKPLSSLSAFSESGYRLSSSSYPPGSGPPELNPMLTLVAIMYRA